MTCARISTKHFYECPLASPPDTPSAMDTDPVSGVVLCRLDRWIGCRHWLRERAGCPAAIQRGMCHRCRNTSRRVGNRITP